MDFGEKVTHLGSTSLYALTCELFSCSKQLTVSNMNPTHVGIPVPGADLEGCTPSTRPSIFCRDSPPNFEWAPQAKRMQQIMRTDFENYNFSLLLRGHIPLRHPLSQQVPKFCQSLIWASPLLKKSWICPWVPPVQCTACIVPSLSLIIEYSFIFDLTGLTMWIL